MFESRGYQLAGFASRPPAPFIQPSIRWPAPRGSLRDGKPPATRKNPPNAVGLPDHYGPGWWRAHKQADLVTNSEGPSLMMLVSARYTVAKHPITDAADAWSPAVPSLVRRYRVGYHSRRTSESFRPPLVLGQILQYNVRDLPLPVARRVNRSALIDVRLRACSVSLLDPWPLAALVPCRRSRRASL